MIVQRLSKGVLTKVILFLVFASTAVLCKSQTRSDTISDLTKFSIDYLQVLFNKRNVNQATSFWTDGAFDDLKAGYNNGKIAYKTNEDLKKLFSKDLQVLLKDIRRPIAFFQSDSAQLLDGDEGDRYFLVHFDFDKNLNVNNDLKNTFLVFISWDRGKTWKLNQDKWVGSFMYYLYRRTNR